MLERWRAMVETGIHRLIASSTVADVVVVSEKNEVMQDLLKRYDCPIRRLMCGEMDGEKVVLLD